jgi:hypothetical protein
MNRAKELAGPEHITPFARSFTPVFPALAILATTLALVCVWVGVSPIVVVSLTIGAIAVLFVSLTKSSEAAWALYFTTILSSGISIPVGPATLRLEIFGLIFLAIALHKTARSVSRRMDPLPAFLSRVALLVWLAAGLFSSVFIAPEPVRSVFSWSQLAFGIVVLFVIRTTPDRLKAEAFHAYLD